MISFSLKMIFFNLIGSCIFYYKKLYNNYFSLKILKKTKNPSIFLGIVVFDGVRNRSWRVVHASMYPNPDEATYKVSVIFDYLEKHALIKLTYMLNYLYI